MKPPGLRVVKRLNLILTVVIFLYTIIIVRVMDIAYTKTEEIKNSIENKRFLLFRHNILDRNGNILATNLPTASLYAHPKEIFNIVQATQKIADAIKMNTAELKKKLNSNKDFVWIKRHLTPKEQHTIHNLGIPGIYFTKDQKRFYPNANLVSHVTGYVDIDGNGISGIEKSFDSILQSKDIHLSIDIKMQYLMREELVKGINTHNALGGVGIIMNVKNGEVISMVSIPDFNPNNITNSQSLFNQASLGIQEMGSIFKILTLATALDLGKITLNDAFNVQNPIKIGRFSIRDYKGKGGYLSVPEIIVYSSNIGAAQIAQRVGIFNQKKYFRKIGLLSPVHVEIPEIAKPMYPNDKRWTEISLMTMSYGHGIAVSPLHLIQAIGASINGGILYQSTLLKQSNSRQGTRVFSESTSNIMRKLLRLTIIKGTGKRADVQGHLVGGKTSTSEKVANGRYLKNLNTALFIGSFPIHDPIYILLVIIDGPKANAINGGITTGGMIAAPIAKETIEQMTQILNMQTYNDEIEKSLLLNYLPRN